MKNHDKSKDQMMDELLELRRQMAEIRVAEEYQRQCNKKLTEQVEYLQSLLNDMNELFLTFDTTGSITLVNKRVPEVLGYGAGELLGTPVFEYIHHPDKERVSVYFQARIVEGITGSHEISLVHKDGSPRVVRINASPIIKNGQVIGGSVLGEDITDRKRIEKNLIESEETYRTIFENTGTAMLIVEENTVVSLANSRVEELTGYFKEEIENKKSWTEFVPDNDLGKMKEYHSARRKDPASAPAAYEFKLIDRGGNVRDIYLNIALISGTKKSVVSLMDITERKQIEMKLSATNEELEATLEELRATEDELRYQISQLREKERQIRHVSLHDSITGLHNRVYFEEEMRRMESGRHNPVGLIICDVDGLKLVNDTLGHDTGDTLLVAAARVIRDSFRGSDVVARVGGDEFAVVLPGSSLPVVEESCRRIEEAVTAYNIANPELPLSISVGYAVRNDSSRGMDDLFKEADNNMYRKKLHSSRSARSAIVQTLMKAIEARDYITEGHAERLQGLVAAVALVLGLPERNVNDLRLLAQFHDIGKVGIPDRILFKPDRLTPEEFEEMRRHSEIGHRIAQSAPDMVPIADWILMHHEWWNGKGYPLGLKGEDIPLECRILAIADAYDAMTSDRPYRKAISHELAMAELRRCAGTQFDPSLIEKFALVLESIRK